jgi:GNAT superfamily N-acetyltransferase
LTTVHEVRRASPEEAGPIADMLARAFCDDPVIEWVFPAGMRNRERKLARFFRIRVRQLLRQDAVWTTPDLGGAAVWALPGRWHAGFFQTLEFLPVMPAMGRRLPTAMRGFDIIEAHHPKEPEHWYLNILGTDPPQQGKGVGSRLLSAVLEDLDRDGVGAYLESSKERNIDFYSRFGFKVVEELRLPKGPPLWPMWRDPA